jgi:Flp pilus assembly protein TadG
MIRRIRNRKEKGQALVEFALTAVFVVLLIAGAVEIIVMIYTYTVLAASAKEGVRYAIVHGTGVGASTCSGPGGGGTTCTDSTAANVKAAVSKYSAFSLHDSTAIGNGVTVNYPDSSSVSPNRVQVTVAYVYQPLFGLGWPTITVNAAAEGRIAF